MGKKHLFAVKINVRNGHRAETAQLVRPKNTFGFSGHTSMLSPLITNIRTGRMFLITDRVLSSSSLSRSSNRPLCFDKIVQVFWGRKKKHCIHKYNCWWPWTEPSSGGASISRWLFSWRPRWVKWFVAVHTVTVLSLSLPTTITPTFGIILKTAHSPREGLTQTRVVEILT